MRINVISPRSEFAHSISRKLGKYEIVWHDINKLPRKPENFHADHDRVIGYLMETDCFCQADENLIKYLRMNAYDGFILVVSRSRQRYRQIEEKIQAIDAGADEYIGYIQTDEEITASVKAWIRRLFVMENGVLEVGGGTFQVNLRERKAYMDGTELPLTKMEFDIVNYLVINRNRAVSYQELYEAVWEKEYLHDDMNIMAHIHRIRKKMGDDTRKPRYIQNVYGIGYMIEGKAAYTAEKEENP